MTRLRQGFGAAGEGSSNVPMTKATRGRPEHLIKSQTLVGRVTPVRAVAEQTLVERVTPVRAVAEPEDGVQRTARPTRFACRTAKSQRMKQSLNSKNER